MFPAKENLKIREMNVTKDTVDYTDVSNQYTVFWKTEYFSLVNKY